MPYWPSNQETVICCPNSIYNQTLRKQENTNQIILQFCLSVKFGIISWSSACQTSLEKIQVVQNNIISIMNFKYVKDKVKMFTLFKSIKLLKVKDIFEQQIAKLMYS